MRGSGVRILFAAPFPLPRTSADVHSASKKHCYLRDLAFSDVQSHPLASNPGRGHKWGHQHSTEGRCPPMLTDTAIRAAKPREKSYKLFDGLGLYLGSAPTWSRL